MKNATDILDAVKKTKAKELVFFFILFGCLLSPGLLSIWYFKPFLLEKLNVLLIVLLSFSITIPIVSLNLFSFMSSVLHARPKELDLESENSAFLLISFALLFSTSIIIIPLFFSILFSCSLKTFLWLLTIFQIIMLVLYLLLYRSKGLPDEEGEENS